MKTYIAQDYISSAILATNPSSRLNSAIYGDSGAGLDSEPEFDEEEYDEDEEIMPVEDINYLRDFIQSSAIYVEQLESVACERSDEFWEAREHAYRIITGLLIDLYSLRVAH